MYKNITHVLDLESVRFLTCIPWFYVLYYSWRILCIVLLLTCSITHWLFYLWISWNVNKISNINIKYQNHKHLPPVPILRLINPIHACPSQFLNIHFNIFLQHMPRSPNSPFPSGLSTNLMHAPLLSPIHVTCPTHLILLYKIQHNLNLILLMWRIWWAPNKASKWQMGFNLAFKGLYNFLSQLNFSIVMLNPAAC